jgi:hypothetical protein
MSTASGGDANQDVFAKKFATRLQYNVFWEKVNRLAHPRHFA